MTEEDRAAITRPAEPNGRPPSRGNANRWSDKGKRKGKSNGPVDRERERDRYQRTYRDNTESDPPRECLRFALFSRLLRCDPRHIAVFFYDFLMLMRIFGGSLLT